MAEAALKLLDNPSTRDMAMTLADKVQICVNHMKSIATNKGVQL